MTNQEIEVVVKHFVQYLGNEAIMRIEKYEEKYMHELNKNKLYCYL